MVEGLCRQSATFHSILNSLYGTLAAHEAHANGRVGVNASRLVALQIVAFTFFFFSCLVVCRSFTPARAAEVVRYPHIYLTGCIKYTVMQLSLPPLDF